VFLEHGRIQSFKVLMRKIPKEFIPNRTSINLVKEQELYVSNNIAEINSLPKNSRRQVSAAIEYTSYLELLDFFEKYEGWKQQVLIAPSSSASSSTYVFFLFVPLSF
jgi:hypothetical protein